jgi:hypothetical protein
MIQQVLMAFHILSLHQPKLTVLCRPNRPICRRAGSQRRATACLASYQALRGYWVARWMWAEAFCRSQPLRYHAPQGVRVKRGI